MKLDRVKVAFGAASVVLFGVLVACGGDDDDDIVPGTSSSGGSSGGDASVSSSSSSGGSSGTSSSSGGANSCTTEYGCWKSTTTKVGNDGDATCVAGTTTTYTFRPEPDGGSDAGVVLPAGCVEEGSDSSTCTYGFKCELAGGTKFEGTQKRVDATHETTSSSQTVGDGAACVSTGANEKVADSFCEVDAATL